MSEIEEDAEKFYINYKKYYDGDGVPVDKKEAAKFCKIAVYKGYLKAIESYLLMLLKGDGIPINKKKATRYCQIAADRCEIGSICKY